jgi:hypothetical protein
VDWCKTGTKPQCVIPWASQTDQFNARLTHLQRASVSASHLSRPTARAQLGPDVRASGPSFTRAFESPDNGVFRRQACGSFAGSIGQMSASNSNSPGWFGCVSTTTAAEYRVMAERCFKRARTTETDEARETYLQLARFWLDLASRLDGPPGAKQKKGFRLWLARARLQT